MSMENNNEVAPYKKVEENARTRAEVAQQTYLESVPQAKWLRLDINGAVLMTPEEFSELPDDVKEFFTKGNMAQQKSDRIALRGENLILLDGHYSGGVSGDLRTERFLSIAEQYTRLVPELIPQLSDQNKEQWKAKLAIWENVTGISTAQFHALKALSLLEKNTVIDIDKAEHDMSQVFEAYFNTLLGKSDNASSENAIRGVQSMIENVSANKDAFVKHGVYDLFRTEREASGAAAMMGAYTWVKDNKLKEIDTGIGLLLGGIDGIEAIRYLDNHKAEMGFSEEQFPKMYKYAMPRVKPIGQTGRVMGKRQESIPLLDTQEKMYQSIPKGSRVAIIDDMITTASNIRDLEKTLNAHGFSSIQFLVNHVGTRWAVNDLAAPEVLDSVHGVAISPTTHFFQTKHQGVEKLLQRMSSRRSLDAIRKRSPEDLVSFLEKAKNEGSARGVGFDVFGTLIEDISYDGKKRKQALHNLWISKIQKWSPDIEFDEFVTTYNTVRERIEKNAKQTRGEFAEFHDDELWREILTRLNIDHPEQKAPDMLEVELEYEKQVRQPVPEMVRAVKEAITLFGENSVGVFSNSRMPREHVVELLKAHGFVGVDGMLKEENILVSSDLGVKKPNPETIEKLSSIISVPAREMIFIGDDAVDVGAAGRSQAIGVQLIRPYNKE